MIRIAFVGAGRMAAAHKQALRRIGGMSFVGAHDVVPERSEKLMEGTDGRAFDGVERMLDEARPDAAVVTLPVLARRGIEADLAERGIHVLAEKPIAMDIQQGLEVCQRIERTGAIVLVGYQIRYHPAVDRMKELLAGKRPALACGGWCHSLPPIMWIRDKSQAGGQLVDQSTHIIDLWRYIIGDITTVYARSNRGLFDDVETFKNDDASAVALTFANGCVGSLASTYASFHTKSTKHGPWFDIVARDLQLRFAQWKTLLAETPKGSETYQPAVDPLAVQDTAWVESIRTGGRSGLRNTYREALRSIEVSLAANRSMETNQPERCDTVPAQTEQAHE